MMVDVEHVLALDRRQVLAGAAPVAHVAENVERIGWKIRSQLPGYEAGFGKEAQVAGNAVLLKLRDPFAEPFEGNSERQPGTQRIAVGLHVTYHHKGAAAAKFCDHFCAR